MMCEWENQRHQCPLSCFLKVGNIVGSYLRVWLWKSKEVRTKDECLDVPHINMEFKALGTRRACIEGGYWKEREYQHCEIRLSGSLSHIKGKKVAWDTAPRVKRRVRKSSTSNRHNNSSNKIQGGVTMPKVTEALKWRQSRSNKFQNIKMIGDIGSKTIDGKRGTNQSEREES